jgi:hypothetical protein
MFQTLADLKNTNNPINRVAGLCPPNDSRFTSYIDEAVRKLMTRGDSAGTVVPIHVCVKRGCVTWPRYVESIRKINLCGSPVQVTNIYSQYLDRDIMPCWYGWPGLYPWGSLGNSYNLNDKGFGSDLRYSAVGIPKTGHYSTYSDPQNTCFIRAYPQYAEDIGKTVTIFGKDENGQPLQTKVTASDGTVTYKPGHIITLASPYGSSSVQIQPPIGRVIKDETEGQVWLYAYDATNEWLEDLAIYEPTETNPWYERTFIGGSSPSGGSCSTITVMALVKLRHIPLKHDTDLVTVSNVDALKMMLQSILFDEADDPDKADRYEAKAIRELNLFTRNLYPEDQTPIVVEPFNATGIGPQQCF